MKSVVIFTKAGCVYCKKLAQEYGPIRNSLSKAGIQLVIWDMVSPNHVVLKHAGGQRVGPTPAALGIHGQFPMPAIMLLDLKKWNPADPSTDHAFLKDAVALFDGDIAKDPEGAISLNHHGQVPRNHANLMTWVKKDHSLPLVAPRQVQAAPIPAPVEKANHPLTCSSRFVRAGAAGPRRR